MLAEALILSGHRDGGRRLAPAGQRRRHEILHAIDQLFPGTASHGELVGLGALFCTFLRATLGDGAERLAQIVACLARHGLPRTPADLGLTDEQFVEAVAYAPQTRPDRYTILEHLDLDDDGCA